MENTIRSFTAIELPVELKQNIELYINDLKAAAPKIKWVKAENLHLTLKFIGNQPAAITDKVIANLISNQAITRPFQLSLSEIGAFPNKKKPRVIWLGINADPHESLYSTFKWIEDQLEKIGIERESRRFSAHLTLGRVKFPGDFTALWEYVQNNPFEPYNFKVNEFVLIRSFLKPAGAEYQVIQKYSLHK